MDWRVYLCPQKGIVNPMTQSDINQRAKKIAKSIHEGSLSFRTFGQSVQRWKASGFIKEFQVKQLLNLVTKEFTRLENQKIAHEIRINS